MIPWTFAAFSTAMAGLRLLVRFASGKIGWLPKMLQRSVYTMFKPALDQIITPEPGELSTFVNHLQDRLEEKLDDEQNPPDAPTLDELL